MEVEVEELLKQIFPDQIADSWKENEDLSEYLIQLSSWGVDRLGREGHNLREERSAILDQTQDLAYSNYKTFIHTADCSKTIFKDFTNVEEHLENLSSSLPTLKSSVDNFLTTSRSLAQSRHLTSLTLTKHTQLLEILELPQLMDTCVRNGYYDEALEILSYVRRLEKKHPEIPIVTSIVLEVQAGTRLMLNQLLGQLRSPLTLPQCLKVVGFLRRLDVFTEPELRLKFLQARDSWFMGILRGIPREDPYHHITKVVEMSRVHLFDIVTQYRAIFSDDDSRFSLTDPEVNESAIFHGWILHKVTQFIRIIEKDLERGVGNNLEAVLAQCMFFGQSFSRIGADFRNLLSPLFLKAALTQFEKDVRNANLKFDETLSCFSFMEATQLNTSSVFMMETQDKTRPPLTLMEFPPMAHYLNGIITSFNTLRQCCPLGILQQVIETLESSITKIVSAIVEVHRLESSGFTSKEELSYERLCNVTVTDVLPHINTCLRLLFPLTFVSQVTGISIAQLQRENFGLIDSEKLISPIQQFLPKEKENEKEDNIGDETVTKGSKISSDATPDNAESSEILTDNAEEKHFIDDDTVDESLETETNNVVLIAEVQTGENTSTIEDPANNILDGNMHPDESVNIVDNGKRGTNEVTSSVTKEKSNSHLIDVPSVVHPITSTQDSLTTNVTPDNVSGAGLEEFQNIDLNAEEPQLNFSTSEDVTVSPIAVKLYGDNITVHSTSNQK